MTQGQRWYVAILVLDSVVEGKDSGPPLVDHQLRVLTAPDNETAYQQALFLGRAEERTYLNPYKQRVTWRFLGLHDLAELEAQPSSGMRIYRWRLRGEPSTSFWPVAEKDQMTVFYRFDPTDRSLG